uniref:RNA dependent RNA polymerase n=1 Tax=Rosellinia necatrix partitivirus 25 TaxID=2699393 RepID=A0A6F8QGY0_9VIRU|nr:RNA dependent RNA polymerase [Rosellinia necatrix partitivirus 25]
MFLPSIRDIYSEAQSRIRKFNQWFHNSNDDVPEHSTSVLLDSQHNHEFPDPESLRHYFERIEKDTSHRIFNDEEARHNAKQTYDKYVERDVQKGEPFEFYTSIHHDDIPPERYPAPGITILPLKFHSGRTVEPTDEVPVTGHSMHPILEYLVTHKWYHYKTYTDTYCRPLDTTQATFDDFNKEQKPVDPIPQSRIDFVLPLVIHFLNALPYLPLHFVDTRRMKMPTHTGTGYFNRFSYVMKTHAAYSHPHIYEQRPTSKGYFYNAMYHYSRTWLHYIKKFASPGPLVYNSTQYLKSLRTFFTQHATLLFTRIHISMRDGALKVRPVYAVDDFFILIEGMLTFPLHAMARISINGTKSCIMYSFETIRGGCLYLNQLAMQYTSFLCIDWSSYDQRLPRVITDIFWTQFLRSLIVINHGYQPTWEYPSHKDLDEHALYQRMDNLLHFLHTWYNNMVFVTSDGFGYLRDYCGVPSGLLNTQYLDSFGNLFLIIDALYVFFSERGLADPDIRKQILQIVFFVMGDDNVLFTKLDLDTLYAFLVFLESYALSRYNMVLSKTKSVLTVLRSRIEILSYRVNNGKPIRPIYKLVAQLCFPEHGPNDKFMSARAIGIAYAAAGQDPDFHEFCSDVYSMFKPFSVQLTPENIERAKYHLPGYFKMFDNIAEEIPFDHFPTIDEVLAKYSTWQGYLKLDKKWDPNWFVNPPYAVPPSSKTMADYQTEHSLPTRDTPYLFNQHA